MKMNRRTILRGIGGATMALPILEGLSSKAAAQGAEQEPYAIFCRTGNGVCTAYPGGPLGAEGEDFWPTATGALTSATMTGRSIGELLAHKDKLLLVKGLRYGSAGDSGCGHAHGGLMSLTGTGPANPGAGEAARASGESIDHRIGRQLNPMGRESLALHASFNSDYLRYVTSYSGPSVLRNPITNPKLAFQLLFPDGNPNTGNAANTKLADRRKSVNDLVRGQMTRLLASPKLSAPDRRRLDLHQSSIRDLEVTLACGYDEATASEIETGSNNFNASDGPTVIRITKLHMDVAALAVACGYTRAVSIQIGNGNDQTRYVVNGETLPKFHHISHRIDSDGSAGNTLPNAPAQHRAIDRLFAQTYAHLIEKLAAYELPDGSLLDHGVSVFLNDLGNPNHSYQNLPWILAGGSKLGFKQGQYMDIGATIHNKMLNTIGAAVGLKSGDGQPLHDFGNTSLATGNIPQMLV